MTREKAEAYSSGKMAGFTMVSGWRASNMDLEHLPAKTKLSKRESGRMERR